MNADWGGSSHPPPAAGTPIGQLRRALRGRVEVARFALVWLVIIAVFVWWHFIREPDDYDFVFSRYNDALVAGDVGGAWGLGCAEDRDRVTLPEFDVLVRDALAPLGGLDSWHRLRGGPEWIGPDGTDRRRPEIHRVDGHNCVRLGGNPLGSTF